MTDGRTPAIEAYDVFENIECLHEELLMEFRKVPVGLGSLARKMMLYGIVMYYEAFIQKQKNGLIEAIYTQLEEEYPK